MKAKWNPVETPFMRPADVAKALGLNIKTVLNAINAEEIPSTKFGTRTYLVPTAWVVRQAQLDEPDEESVEVAS